MTKIIGIYKELRSDEDIISETLDFVRVEAESSPFGTDFFNAKVYLTNRRILFLVATNVDLKKAKKELEQIAENDSLFRKSLKHLTNISIGEQKVDSTALISTWMEVPINAIRELDTPSGFFAKNKNQLIVEFDVEKKKGILNLFSKKPTIVIHLDNRDLWKTSILNAMKERKFGQKISDGYRIDGEGRIICSLCGTHYEELKAKIVQCSECKKFICREKQEGMFSKKWIKTDCFDNKKMLCIVCSRKK